MVVQENLIKVVKYFLKKAKLEIRRTYNQNTSELSPTPISKLVPTHSILDLAILENMANKIPGMSNSSDLKILSALCFYQTQEGDVVEIGSWQGRSTIFLKYATDSSKNGAFFAIDNFKGNVGFEEEYIVGTKDLSDLKSNFLLNMRNTGIKDISLLDMHSEEAVLSFKKQIRFLFIDGDHSPEGVMQDVKLFYPCLVESAIVVFDDFAAHVPGVLNVATEYLSDGRFVEPLMYKNTLIVRKGPSSRVK
jgi:predicted O-methyltransferase YrrM